MVMIGHITTLNDTGMLDSDPELRTMSEKNAPFVGENMAGMVDVL
jgi:hypothetical protein